MMESEKQPSKNVAEFNQLVEDVEKIDPKAAEYLRLWSNDVDSDKLSGEFRRLFCWSLSPQKYDYWRDIDRRLEEMRGGKNEHLTVSKIRETVNVAEFNQLVEDVEKIDIAAAKYLRLWSKTVNSCKLCGILSPLFRWKDSPQGYNYWMEINRQLRAMRAREEFITISQKAAAPREPTAADFSSVYDDVKRSLKDLWAQELGPRELTMEDLRRDCFPAEYTWYAKQPKKELVVEKEPPVRGLVEKVLTYRRGLKDEKPRR
jgi:hypothetical protein